MMALKYFFRDNIAVCITPVLLIISLLKLFYSEIVFFTKYFARDALWSYRVSLYFINIKRQFSWIDVEVKEACRMKQCAIICPCPNLNQTVSVKGAVGG